MGMFFGARNWFSFGRGGRVWKIGEEGVDVEGEGYRMVRGLFEEGTCQIAKTELLCCGGGRTRPWMVGYWEKILNGGLGLFRFNAGEREGERLTRKTRRGC